MSSDSLKSLGKRICILGPSNSGKSTLCAALSRKLEIKGHHLDQIAHIPKSDYRFRPSSEWVTEHDQIIEGEFWIIDGNYSICMRSRFERATGVIRLNPNRFGSVYRFIRRSIKSDPNRPGALEGASAEFSWRRVRFILFGYPKVRKEHDQLLADYNHLEIIEVNSMGILNEYYRKWQLSTEP